MRNLRSLTLKVEVSFGTDIREACCDLCELANRVGCLIEADVNGVKLWAKAEGNPLTLHDGYHKALGSAGFKFAHSW